MPIFRELAFRFACLSSLVFGWFSGLRVDPGRVIVISSTACQGIESTLNSTH